jgi:hypothetical protein
VYFMKEKSEVSSHFQNFKMLAEKQTWLQVKCLRSNGGGEYFFNEFTTYSKCMEFRGNLHVGIFRSKMKLLREKIGTLQRCSCING